MSELKVEDVARVVLEVRPDHFVEFMARVLGIQPQEYPQVRSQLERMHSSLRQTFVSHLDQILKDRQLDLVFLTHPDADHAVIAELKQHLLDRLLEEDAAPPSPLPLTPELREWASREYTEEEIVAGMREAREQNGPELKQAIQRLEQELRARERANP